MIITAAIANVWVNSGDDICIEDIIGSHNNLEIFCADTNDGTFCCFKMNKRISLAGNNSHNGQFSLCQRVDRIWSEIHRFNVKI